MYLLLMYKAKIYNQFTLIDKVVLTDDNKKNIQAV